MYPLYAIDQRNDVEMARMEERRVLGLRVQTSAFPNGRDITRGALNGLREIRLVPDCFSMLDPSRLLDIPTPLPSTNPIC